ncbi:hypothetical protein KSS93_10480 [Pseudomonas xanthosomatis]|uniref:hypothetical protein n=1 Tax=Pseudomonas xanthosomatis TaxID=2842356 RepID=UPI001C3E0AB3|nr:hypothetical protein [Pseudomonas xanthosomatis]QXH48311.1 hypothetical protein KSS93_10480 [Pseudomonas xanthosomatis]
MLTEKEIARRLADAESSHGLFAFEYNGIALWRLVRSRTGFAMQGHGLQPRALDDRLALLVRGLRSCLDYGLALLKGRRRYVVKTYSSALRTLREGRYEDIYFDALMTQVAGGSKWSYCNSVAFASREKQARVRIEFDTSFVQIASALLARVWSFSRDPHPFGALANAVEQALGPGILSASQARFLYAKFRWQVCFYSLLLRRQRPAVVCVVNTGEYALMHAAQRSGIRFIELQHGIFSADHPDALPEAALDQARGDLLLPDVLAVYGEYWRNYLSGTAIARLERIVPCGCAVLEEYRGVRRAISDGPPSAQPLQILLTTQGLSVGELVGCVSAFLDACARPLTLNMKLHPIYDDEAAYQVLAQDSRVRILGATDATPTHLLMARADMHVSISSACHYDALAVGVPTVVLRLPGHELMLPLIESGDAVLVRSASELSEYVGQLVENPSSAEHAEYFCRTGFVQNLREVAGLVE